MVYSTTEINFLEVTVTKVGNKLETDLCCKPTNTHEYLHAQSCHCNVHKKSIAYGQAVRTKRIFFNKRKPYKPFRAIKTVISKSWLQRGSC